MSLLAATLFLLSACSTYNPKDPGDTTVLIAPTNLTLRLVAGAVEANWQFNTADSVKVKEYRVYRRSASEASFKRLATVAAPARRYRDLTVTVGVPYQYQIAAANNSNVEGQPSDAATVTPAVFGVLANNGAKFTNRRLITLSFNASNNTAQMMIANDAAFTGAIWEAFANTKIWELAAGDGLKTVFAKFRTGEQAESDVVSVNITLDTIALINAITHDGASRTLATGDVLHLRLDVGRNDPFGAATVDLVDNNSSARENNLRLYDNGSNGDATPNDGVYELDYRIRPDLEFVQAFAYGNFTDAAGNLALQRVSPTSFSVQNPPKPVTLSKPVADSTALKLTWTASTERDFANYRVFRSTVSPVDSTVAPLTIINDNGTTTFRDEGVAANTNYFYRVFVYDRSGLSAGSNEVQGQLKK